MKSLMQVLSSIGHKTFDSRGHQFEHIVGHSNIKLIFGRAISSKKPIHIILVGKPGSAKTMFLLEIMKTLKQSYFTVGSNTSKAGLVNQLFEKKPKYLLIDELDKMNSADQTSLLNLMETCIISETKIKKTRQMHLTTWVFATANNSEKIIEPLLSRFVVLQVPEYTLEEFIEIAVSNLRKETVQPSVARLIAEKVWSELGSKDFRDVIKISRLSRSSEEVSFVVKMLKKK